MKSAIYIRVSTEEQAKERYSLTTQREYLENYAKREGYEIPQLSLSIVQHQQES